jgi:hypothetical protein
MDEKRAGIAKLLHLYREMSCNLHRVWLRKMLTSTFGPEQAEESVKDLKPQEVTEEDIDEVTRLLDVALFDVGSTRVAIKQHEAHTEPPGPDPSTWRTRPGLF